jgi:hypothetical protein
MDFVNISNTVKYCYWVLLIQLLRIADTETTEHFYSYEVHIHTVFLCINDILLMTD